MSFLDQKKNRNNSNFNSNTSNSTHSRLHSSLSSSSINAKFSQDRTIEDSQIADLEDLRNNVENNNIMGPRKPSTFSQQVLLFVVSLFLISRSEAFAATTFSPSNCQNSHIHKIQRGGSLSASTETDINGSGGGSSRNSSSHKNKANVESKRFINKSFGGKTFLNGDMNGKINGGGLKNGKASSSLKKWPKIYNPPTADKQLPCHYIADTKLPTDIGNFRLRAYRVDDIDFQTFVQNKYVGSEPCVIYCADNPPFGDGSRVTGLPVRIHDQCLTSEVFGSKR